MKRRGYIAGFGTVVASGGFVLSSGAFTSVSADRTITVNVADDTDALLKIDSVGDGGRSTTKNGQLKLNIPGTDEDKYGGTDPDGIGTDSVYWFGADAGGSLGDGLFKITNQGTQDVNVYGTDGSEDDEPSVAMFDADSETVFTESNPYESLGIGKTLYCGIRLDTHGADVAHYDVPMMINAVADN
ncbi:MAG: hypothetical protein ABEI77_04740 [Halorientalis sp.]